MGKGSMVFIKTAVTSRAGFIDFGVKICEGYN